MSISLDLELRTAETQARLQDMIARMDNRRPFFAAVGQLLTDSARARFREERDPDGKPWTPLRPRTIKARERRGQTPITILRSNTKGRAGSPLSGSINFAATDDEVRIGSPVHYAAIHQLGGTIDRPAGTRWMAGRRFARRADAPEGREVVTRAHVITIPARSFLGVAAEDEEEIFETAERWLMP